MFEIFRVAFKIENNVICRFTGHRISNSKRFRLNIQVIHQVIIINTDFILKQFLARIIKN